MSKIIKIINTGNQSFLTNGKDKVEIPSNYLVIVNFILKHEIITTNLIISKFKNLSKQEINECLEQLNNMKVIV